MLTPVELQNNEFKSAGLGYDKKDVDNYMKEIIESYELLYRERIELNEKINVLNDALSQYKTIEKTMQKALVLAEKTAEETKASALANARLIEDEAANKANEILAGAKKEYENIRRDTLALLQQFETYKLQFKNLAKTQVELLESDAFNIKISEMPPSEAFSPKTVNSVVSDNKQAENAGKDKNGNDELFEIVDNL